jgi:hypothetical protein
MANKTDSNRERKDTVGIFFSYCRRKEKKEDIYPSDITHMATRQYVFHGWKKRYFDPVHLCTFCSR